MSLRPIPQHGRPLAASRAPAVFRAVAGLTALLVVWGCSSGTSAAVPGGSPASAASGSASGPPTTSPSPAPKPLAAAPAHTVIVMMENRSYSDVIGSRQAPYLNRLASQGALFTHSSAVSHPSEPNYLALFSGSTQGVTDDSCPLHFTAANLGSELIAAGKTFAGYSEDLPRAGAAVCTSGGYARKHVPWINFSNVSPAASQPFSKFPAPRYARLPTVSFVIPNLCHDMHDCSVATGDAWLKAHVSRYASWARRHHSLLIVTWDENDGSSGNHIATIFAGPMVRPGRYGEHITHYSVLRTIERLYRLPLLGNAATARLIRGIWR